MKFYYCFCRKIFTSCLDS